MKRIAKVVFIASLLFIAAPLWLKGGSNIHFQVEAEPSWARRYNAKCTLCHTTNPRLNRTGYEFKRLGYRLPREVEAKGTPPATTAPGASQAQRKPFVIQPTGYKPKPATPESDRGKALFEKLDCASCHSIASKGGRIGPPLDGVGGRRNEQFLTAHITNPEEHAKKFPELHGNQASRMPHPQTTAEEVRLLVAYLVTLPEPAAGFQVNPHHCRNRRSSWCRDAGHVSRYGCTRLSVAAIRAKTSNEARGKRNGIPDWSDGRVRRERYTA